MSADPSLAEIAHEIEVLETLDAFATQLGDFTSRLSTYSGQDLGALTTDPTIAYELGQLKTLATTLSSTLADADEVLGKGPGVAGHVNEVVSLLQRFATEAGRAESMTGSERLAAMGEFVGSIETIASALTGLGSLNPVIGVFISLYATALASAADTAAYLQTVHDTTIDVMRRTDGQGDTAEDIAAAAAPEPDPAIAEAQRRAHDRLEGLYQARANALAQQAAHELKAARDHCARIHRDALDAAGKEASRFGFTGHLTADGMDGDAAGALEEWLATPRPGLAQDMAAASQEGGAAITPEVAAKVREVMDSRRRVSELMRDWRDCVDHILQHGYTPGGGPVQGASVGAAGGMSGAAAAPALNVKQLALIGAGVLAVAAIAVPALSGGSDGSSSDTSPATSSSADPSSGGTSSGVAAEGGNPNCPGIGERAGQMTAGSPVMTDGDPASHTNDLTLPVLHERRTRLQRRKR